MGGKSCKGCRRCLGFKGTQSPSQTLPHCPNGRNKEEMGMLNREVKREKGMLHGELENLASGPKSATY